MAEPEIRRIDSKIVYKNRWMTVREDRVRRANGDHGLFGVVHKLDYSLIVPFDGEKFHLVQQYRYPVDGRFWEFPQGSKELNPEATPEQIAAEELAEETGLSADTTIKLGKLFQAYGYSNQGVHVFLATDLNSGEALPEASEEGLITQAFTREQCDQMLMDGQISDLATVAAFHLFDRHMKQTETSQIPVNQTEASQAGATQADAAQASASQAGMTQADSNQAAMSQPQLRRPG